MPFPMYYFRFLAAGFRFFAAALRFGAAFFTAGFRFFTTFFFIGIFITSSFYETCEELSYVTC